jgi:hypothetical protein
VARRWSLLGAVLLASGCHDSTGLHVFARLGALTYDALALQIARPTDTSGAPPQVLVDPTTNGRYAGPFHGGDQDVYVYLPDELDGARLECTMTALLSSAVVGQGQTDATVHRQAIEDVQIFMVAAGAGGAGGTGGSSGEGGLGGSTPGAAGAGPPTGGSSGSSGSQKSGNGNACNSAPDCASDHCVDGICCESDCTGACTSCANPGTQGLCRPAPAGAPDPRGMCADMGATTCGTNGLCDVSGHCAKYPAGTACGSATCKNDGMMTPAPTCDGAGACQQAPKMKCAGACTDAMCTGP